MAAVTTEDTLKDFKTHDNDTGSTPVQIARLSQEITALTEHLKEHPKDEHSRRGLFLKVGKRRKLLKYLQGQDKEVYQKVVERFGLRK